MTSLLEGAKKLVTRGTDTGARIEGLAAAADAARGRLDDALVDDAEKVVDRATSRLRLSAGHTVVAIAGATGSGKSSTFNALTGLELSAVGVRRPTTSWATACVWGTDGAGELLEAIGRDCVGVAKERPNVRQVGARDVADSATVSALSGPKRAQ